MTAGNIAKVEILRTDGSREQRLIAKPTLLRSIKRFIGAEVTDTVNLRDGRILIVDDHGYETEAVQEGNKITLKPTRALKPVNEAATALYHAVCVPGATHKIVGDAAVAWDKDFT